MNKLLLMMVTLVLNSCASVPQISEQVSSAPGTEGFYEVTKLQQFAEAYVKDRDALQGYQSVVFSELQASQMEIDKSRLDRSNDYWELQQQDIENAKRMFKEQIDRYYQKARHLALTESAAENTLQVDMILTKYRPNAPRDSARGRTAGEMYFSEGAGRLYMVTKVSDAQTGELLAVFEDDRELGTTWEKDSRVNNTRRFKQGLYTWVQRIDNAVADLQ